MKGCVWAKGGRARCVEKSICKIGAGMNSFHSDSSSKSNANGGMRAAENGGVFLTTAPRKETCSMLYEGLGDYAPDAIIYDMLIDEPAMYLLGRCEQKGCWV